MSSFDNFTYKNVLGYFEITFSRNGIVIYRNELRCDLVISLMAVAYLDRKMGVKSVTLISRTAFCVID